MTDTKLKHDFTLRLASRDGSGWTVEWSNGIDHMAGGATLAEALIKALVAQGVSLEEFVGTKC